MTRQNLDTLRKSHDELNLYDLALTKYQPQKKKANLSILSSGSEVSIAIKAKEILEEGYLLQSGIFPLSGII